MVCLESTLEFSYLCHGPLALALSFFFIFMCNGEIEHDTAELAIDTINGLTKTVTYPSY